MSLVTDALAAVRQALSLARDVAELRERLGELAFEVRDHDRRITRIEALWEASVRLGAVRLERKD